MKCFRRNPDFHLHKEAIIPSCSQLRNALSCSRTSSAPWKCCNSVFADSPHPLPSVCNRGKPACSDRIFLLKSSSDMIFAVRLCSANCSLPISRKPQAASGGKAVKAFPKLGKAVSRRLIDELLRQSNCPFVLFVSSWLYKRLQEKNGIEKKYGICYNLQELNSFSVRRQKGVQKWVKT